MESLQDHKQLEVLNLSNNNITSFKEIGNFFANNKSVKAINLKGNVISSQNEFNLIMKGIEKNTTLSKCDLTFDDYKGIMRDDL